MIISVVDPTEPGFVTLYPADEGRPIVSSINFPIGGVTNNNGFFKLSTDSAAKLSAYSPTGVLDLILDVTGYFGHSSRWTVRSEMPTARFQHRLASVADQIYALGGFSSGSPGGARDEIERYDPRTDTWTTMKPMPTPLYRFGAAVVDDSIYVIGGSDGSETSTNVYQYNPATEVWSERASVPTASPYGKAIGLGDRVYFFSEGIPFGQVLEYDTVADSWTTLASVPTPRACASPKTSGLLARDTSSTLSRSRGV